MDIETALNKLIEHAREELKVRNRRDQQKANQADHGHDYSVMMESADQLDRYAAEVRRLHDDEFQQGWRKRSAE
ncbi:hypothetical protein ACIBF1_24010 [Spirillospora sp. NPDC050679]